MQAAVIRSTHLCVTVGDDDVIPGEFLWLATRGGSAPTKDQRQAEAESVLKIRQYKVNICLHKSTFTHLSRRNCGKPFDRGWKLLKDALRHPFHLRICYDLSPLFFLSLSFVAVNDAVRNILLLWVHWKISIEEEKALHNGRLGHLLREGRMTHLICVSIRQLIHSFMAGFSLLVWGFSCSFSSAVGANC